MSHMNVSLLSNRPGHRQFFIDRIRIFAYTACGAEWNRFAQTMAAKGKQPGIDLILDVFGVPPPSIDNWWWWLP